ncbi:MAG: hypothetical protein RM368_37225 [Nostoc sp. DedSLP03]|uniref:hypothetical protein n=1 Tax=Nostoc sp. DedSLP03 TaxID=3075400 RepID=UPI002AD1F7FB|nr:hypothetical protein [Nostoc sp. DedSLP03]MDZ7970509.1 hypothetical protein [Nostoc sp. DedSLP03]
MQIPEYADPAIQMEENTKKVLSILPPIEEAPTPINRPINNHAKPHTVPQIQEQIRQNSQPYIPSQYKDRPSGAAVSAGTQLRTSNQLRSDNIGVNFAMNSGQSQLGAELAYEFNWYFSGLSNGLFPNNNTEDLEATIPFPSAEGGFYQLGKNHAGNIQDTIDKGREIIREIRDNPPRFEMPQITIPRIEIPEIPEFKFPELPEFRIPEFKFQEPQEKDKPQIEKPKPKPITNTRKLRELELSPCGSISFRYVRASKVTGTRIVFTPEGYYEERVQEPATIQEVYDTHITYNLQGNDPPTLKQFIEMNGGTGSSADIAVSEFTSYHINYGLGGSINVGQQTYYNNLQFPFYSYGFVAISVNGVRNKSAINAVLDNLDGQSNIPGEVYEINVSQPDAKDCPINKPIGDKTPPEPQENCECMNCCPEIDYRKIKALIDEALKDIEPIASLPISWQIRNEGSRPQLVIQCAEENGVDTDGNKKYKSAMYPISVPHWDGTPSDKITLPSYIKGNYEGIFTLSDNSKVTINAQNELQCKRILNAIIPHISKAYLKDAYFKGGNIVRETPIKESRVKPRYGRYFKNGQKNNKPDWRVDFT